MARIAHFIDTKETGGAERVVVDLAASQLRLGHQTEVFHFGNGWIEERCRRLGIASVVLPDEPWYRSKWTVGAFALRLAQVSRRRGVDLLHSHLYGPISAGAVAAVAAGIPHVGTLHDVYLIKEQPKRFRMLRVAAALGTQLVAVSEEMRRFYMGMARGGMVLERIYNGVDVAAFGSSPRRGSGPFTFVSVGRLVSIKGFDLLLDAMARAGSTLRLRLVGDGPERQALEAQAAALGIAPQVEFLGYRDDVAEVLAEADAFVLASRSEGLSCSVIEAMASALPCVVTDVGGNRELMADGGCGFLVPAGDASALALRMRQLAADRTLAQALGSAARKRAESGFSMDAFLRGYDEVYRSLLPVPATVPRGDGVRATVQRADVSPRAAAD